GLVIERARQNARRGGLADPANASEHPGLRDAARLERVLERAYHRLLADKVVEILGAILAGENAVGAISGFCVHELPFRSPFASFAAASLDRTHERRQPKRLSINSRRRGEKGGRLAR